MQLNEKAHSHKGKKSLFIPIRLHSITISSVIDYILEVYSTSNSLKKKKEKKNFGKKRGKENEVEKRRRRKKGMEGVCAEEGETDVEEKKKQKRGE